MAYGGSNDDVYQQFIVIHWPIRTSCQILLHCKSPLTWFLKCSA